MGNTRLGDRLGSGSGYVKVGKSHPRFVMRNRRGFHPDEDTRDAGRARARARTNMPAESTVRGRTFRERLSSVERLAYSLIRTCDTALRKVGARRDPKFKTRCLNWSTLVKSAKKTMRDPRVAAALNRRSKPKLVVGCDVVVIPLPRTGGLPTRLTVGTLVGTDKSERSDRAFVKTARSTICFPGENVFCLSE